MLHNNFEIDCKEYKEIPDDYSGVIGVPITYLAYHCVDQFEILGKFDGGTESNELDLAKPIINGKIIIDILENYQLKVF